MEETVKSYGIEIEMDLYLKVLLIVESMIGKQEKFEKLENLSKNYRLTKQEKLSKPDMVKERREAIANISELINWYANEKNLNVNDVKEYLIELLEKDIQKNIKQNQEKYLEEYNKAKKILEEDVR